MNVDRDTLPKYLPMRTFAYLTLFTGLALSGIAGFYSVIGLAMIFSGAFIPVIVLASVLEVSKLVAVSWMYRYRHFAGRLLRFYFYVATLVLMGVTSMGIFGFLTRAHVESEGTYTTAQLTLQEIQQREAQLREQREQVNTELKTLNEQSSQLGSALIAAQRLRGTQGAIAVQRENTARRTELLKELQQTTADLTAAQQERITIEAETHKATADIGPLRYVAQAVYGNEDVETIRQAVVWLTVILMTVFDPMAVMLLIAANILFVRLQSAILLPIVPQTPPVETADTPDIPAVSKAEPFVQTYIHDPNTTDVPKSLL